MSCFYTNGSVFCPKCPARFRKTKPDERVGVRLECVESNYHGCSVDHALCPECETYFSISYKVDDITELDW